MAKKILVIVDYQYDFVRGALPVNGAESIANNIQREIDNKEYDSIIYTLDTHVSDDYFNSEESKAFPDIHCEFNTPGWELFKIKPRNRAISTILSEGIFEEPTDFSINNEYVFMKDKFSIWEGNERYAKWFNENFPKDTEITIVGIALDYCVKFNATGYKQYGYENVRILSSAVKGIADDSINEALNIFEEEGIRFV